MSEKDEQQLIGLMRERESASGRLSETTASAVGAGVGVSRWRRPISSALSARPSVLAALRNGWRHALRWCSRRLTATRTGTRTRRGGGV